MSLAAHERQALALIGAQLRTAVRPVVLCSFGKDSLVLLHLCLRLRKVPVIFFRFPKFHEKHAHALRVMQDWDLEVFDLWPRLVTEYQHGDFFEVLHHYHLGNDAQSKPGLMALFSGIRARLEGETRYLCAVDDLLDRPKSHGNDYPWDVTMLGHKGTDDPEIGSMGPIVQSVSQLGSTRLVVPFIDWSDHHIWDYIRKYDLPYDRQRYEEKDETVSPDKYPTCYRCLDYRQLGESVDCPKHGYSIPSIARSADDHEVFRQALVGAIAYCDITGPPRSTENVAHL